MFAVLLLLFSLDAAGVVARVQAFYKTDRHHATFTQTYTNATFGKATKSKGTLTVVRPGQMSWDYTKPEKKRFVSDGKTLWVIEPESRQAFKKDLGKTLLPVSVTFLMGKGDLTAEFDVKLDTDAKGAYAAKGHAVLVLTPKQASAQLEKVVLVVDEQTGAVARSVVFEPSGNTNDFSFTKRKTGKDVPAIDFTVKEAELKKQGLKVIEAKE